MSHFAFLKAEWPDVHEAAAKAEALAVPDPRTCCFYARRSLELLIHWMYKHDGALRLPYQDNLNALVHEPTFKSVAGEAVFTKARVLTRLGNNAVHSPRPVQVLDAQTAVRELFHVGYWLAHTYAKGAKPQAGMTFNPQCANPVFGIETEGAIGAAMKSQVALPVAFHSGRRNSRGRN